MKIVRVESAEAYVDRLFSVLSICDLYAYLKAKDGVVIEPSKYAGMDLETAYSLLPRRGRVVRVVGNDFEYILVMKDLFKVRIRRQF